MRSCCRGVKCAADAGAMQAHKRRAALPWMHGAHFLPSPLVGEGGSIARSAIETGEGFSPRASLAVVFADRTPHPALRATFSHKGRREEDAARLTDKSNHIQMSGKDCIELGE